MACVLTRQVQKKSSIEADASMNVQTGEDLHSEKQQIY
jgi:hypothetical protein